MNKEQEQQLSEIWEQAGQLSPDKFRKMMDDFLADFSADDPIVLFERASAFDSTGSSDLAVPLYRQALEAGLSGGRKRRAIIQMASSLRNLGEAEESLRLLKEEIGAGNDELDDALHVFQALALADLGREREALAIMIERMAPHLPRYQISAANYARILLVKD